MQGHEVGACWACSRNNRIPCRWFRENKEEGGKKEGQRSGSPGGENCRRTHIEADRSVRSLYHNLDNGRLDQGSSNVGDKYLNFKYLSKVI